MKPSEMRIPKTSENIQSQLNTFVKRKVSPSLFVTDGHELNENTFVYSINNSYPKMIWDNNEELAIYRFINVHNIGTIKAKVKDDIIKVIDMTERGRLQEKFDKEIQNIYKKSEMALLKTIHDSLVRIPFVQTAMSPIRTILEKVDREGVVPVGDKFGYRNLGKTEKYIDFLSSLNFIRVENEKIYPDKELNAIRNLDISLKEFHNKILSAVLRRGFAYIQDYLHLTLITPFIRLSNSYFLPSYESEKLLEFSIEDFRKSYHDIYNIRKSKNKISRQLSYITEQNILQETKRGFYTGERGIFEEFRKIAPSI